MVTAMHPRLAQALLCGILDLGYVAAARVLIVPAELCRGGVDLLKLRAKSFVAVKFEQLARTIQPI